jgi:hypothetical protein
METLLFGAGCAVVALLGWGIGWLYFDLKRGMFDE